MSQQPCSQETPDSTGSIAGFETEPVHGVGEVAVLIAQAVHDLRSSLNAIQSWAHVLDRSMGEASGSSLRALTGIRTGVQQHLLLIEHMGEAVRLLANEGPSRWQPIDLLGAVQNEVGAMRYNAEERGIDVTDVICDEPADGGYLIDGDPERLGPLVRHLLIHCLWHARSGGRVAVHLKSEGDQVKLRVTETPGRGANVGDRIGVLTDFFGRRKAAPGSAPSRQSMDLLLTRRLVELHNARLIAEHEDEDTDSNVCVAVRFPRHSAQP